jgi:hypothetical protein
VCFCFNTIPESTLLVRSELSMQEEVKRQLLFLLPPPPSTCYVSWFQVHFFLGGGSGTVSTITEATNWLIVPAPDDDV